LQAFALAVGNGNGLHVGYHRDALRLTEPGQALHVGSGFDVEDLDRVVSERCDIQSLRGPVEGEMIDAAFHTWKVDGPDQREWLLCPSRLERDEHDDQSADDKAHKVLT